MTIVKFYDTVDDALLRFAVIVAKTAGRFVLCRHRERKTFEFPGGHREEGEAIEETAGRELYEETGAVAYEIRPVCAYSVTRTDIPGDQESYGMLYYAEVSAFEGELHSEIGETIVTDTLSVDWTYPDIQPELLKEAARRNLL